MNIRVEAREYLSVIAVASAAAAMIAYCYDLKAVVAGAALSAAALALGALSIVCARHSAPKALLSAALVGSVVLAPVGLFFILRSSEINLISTVLIGDWGAEREAASWALFASSVWVIALTAATRRSVLAPIALIFAAGGALLSSAQILADPIETRNSLILISAALVSAVAQKALPDSWERHTLGVCAVFLVTSRVFMSLNRPGEILIAALILLTVAAVHARAPGALSSLSLAAASLIAVDQMVDIDQAWLFVWIVVSLALLWRTLTFQDQVEDPEPSELAAGLDLSRPSSAVSPVSALVSNPVMDPQ